MEQPEIRVLLIEDDEDDYILTRSILTDIHSSTFDLDWVNTYDTGLDALCRTEYDVALLDYRLGEQNGLKLLQEATAKGCKEPIILLTGQGDHEVDLEAMRAGAADYLIKGLITHELLERSIRYSIERKRAERELSKYRDHLEELVTEQTFQLKERTKQLAEANECLQREIEERRKAEEKLLRARKLEAAGILAGGIAHDFNNILAAVLGHINLAQLSMEPGSVTFAALENAEKAIFQASQITKRFLTFSTGGVPLKETVSIRTLLSHSVSLALNDSKVECKYTFPDDLWDVHVDSNQMTQVFTNMIVNAREAMSDEGKIGVEAENFQVISASDNIGLPLKAGPYVKVTIKDNGKGIAQEDISKVFDPYFSTKGRSSEKGMGLSLAVALSVVVRHGGFLDIESEVGKGTALYIYVPAVERMSRKTQEP